MIIRDRYFVPGSGEETLIGVFVYDLNTGESIGTVNGDLALFPITSAD